MNNKRKPRGGANRSDNRDRGGAARSNNTKTPDRETRGDQANGGGGAAAKEECEGVYKNARFTHAVTSLIGNTLRVETQNNIEFEGILKTFSPQLEMVLEWVHEIDVKMPDCINHETVKEKMVFPIKDIVRYYAIDVDLNFATKEEFQTDTQISNKINGDTPMRELEQWMPDGNDSDMVDLGETGGGNSNGWSAHDMFAKNKEFGVETSYDHNLSGYTIQLNKDTEKSAEYRERERKAAQIAAEIEGNTHSIAAVELENGDEEEAFSAVVRDKASPGHHDSPGGEKAYVPPGRRDQGMRGGPRGGGGGRGARTTPPGNDDYRGNRYDNRGYNNNRGGYNNDRGERYERGGYNPDYRGDRYRQEGGRDSHRPGDRDNRGGYKKDDKKASPIPEQEKQVDRRKSGEGVMAHKSPGGHEPDQTQRLGKKSREQQSTEFKEFQENFQLAPAHGPSKSPTSSTPRVSVKQSGASQGSTPLPSPQPGSGGETPGGAPPPASSPATPSAADASSGANTSGNDSVKKSTLNPNAKEFSLNPTAKEFTPRGPPSASRVAPTPPRPQTPNTPNSMNAMAGIPQAFSQAGAYILAPGQMGMTHVNVNNGMFVHAGPQHMMTAGGQPIASIAAGHPGQPGQQMQPGPGAVQINPPYGVQAQTRPGGPPGNQRGQGGKDTAGTAGRPDLPSPLQVAGHPIIAGGVPGHQPQFMAAGYPGHQPGLYPGHPSQAPPVIRMVMPGPGGPGGMIAAGPGMVPVMSQADSGPGQTQAPAMWSGQGAGGPGQHPPPTPPQPNTPAPSPGLPQMYSGPPGHHQPHSYPGGPGGGQVPSQGPGHLVVIPGHAGFPHNIPTSAVAGPGQPHPHMGGAPHMMGGAGQPVTSMAHQPGMMPQQFHYMPQHQGHPGPGAHMLPQHNQQ